MKNLNYSQLYVLFNAWSGAKDRCTNPKNAAFKHYGGRGIRMCERWLRSFDAFVIDMGVRPEGLSLDRIDVDKGYEPGNCRWADKLTQARNRRSTKLSQDQMQEVQAAIALGESASAIAFFYGVSASYVRMIAKRQGTPAGASRKAVLDKAKADAIRSRHAGGEHTSKLALEYGVSVRTVQTLLKGQSWK